MKTTQKVGQLESAQRKKSILRRSKEAGMSMIELSLVLIIAAGAVAVAVNYFSTNNTGSQSNQLATDLSMLMGRVKSAYAGQYSNVSNAKLNTGGFFSGYPTLTNNAGVVTLAMGGGTLTVSPGTVTAANDSVKYVLTQMPDASCTPLLTALAKGATTLSVGASVVKAAGSLPDPSKITCSNDNNTITLQAM